MAAREPSTLWWSTPGMSSTRSAQIRRHSFSSSMPPRRYSQVTATTASLAKLADQSRFAHSDNEDQGRWPATKRQLPPPEVQRSGRLRRNWTPTFVEAPSHQRDCLHIVKHLNEAVDATRRELWQLTSKEKVEVKGTRWLLLKNPWNLTNDQKERLSTLVRWNSPLVRAWYLKESFQVFWSYKQPWRAKQHLL